MPIYTRLNLKTDTLRSYAGVTNVDRLINQAVREVVSDIDLRSTKRRAYLSPYLSTDIYDYQAPSDLKGWGIIDVRRIPGRTLADKFNIVQSEYFDRYKSYNKNLVAIENQSFFNKLRVSADLQGSSEQAVIDDCESLTANGPWAASLDAYGLFLDRDTFIIGEAALGFDMDASGATTTTAGFLTNPLIPTALDLSDYKRGSVFVRVWAPTVTGLGGFTLKIGSSASNYLSRQVTVTNENLAFYPGWMLLRFDLDGATETGTVDYSGIDYVQFAVNRSGGTALNTAHWRIDQIVAVRGVQHEVWYYTKFGWQNTSGTYLENSSSDTDLINCDTEEYDLFILRAKKVMADDLKQFTDSMIYANEYLMKKQQYLDNYKSERLLLIQDYYNLGSNMNESWLP